MILTHVVALIALSAAPGVAYVAGPVAPFSPQLEHDAGGPGLCQIFLADVGADFFEGAPGVGTTPRHRRAPPVYADALSDKLVEMTDPETSMLTPLTRFWGDIDGDQSPEEVVLTTYGGDGANGYRTFAGLTKLDIDGVAAVRKEWRRLFATGYHDGSNARRNRESSILSHIMQDTYVIVVDYGPSTGPNKKFWKRFSTPSRDEPQSAHLKSVADEALNYRLPFRVVDYRGRLYAETIVDYGWNGDDKNFAAARRVLISFDETMRPHLECVVVELPDQDHPQLLLTKSENLQALLAAIEKIEGGSCDRGSLNSSGAHKRARRALVREATARPWLVSRDPVYPDTFANKNLAAGDYDWLRIWRLLGPWNAAKFGEMEAFGEAVRVELEDYYSDVFDADDETAEDWARRSIRAIKAAAALGAPERNRRLTPLSDKIENGTATALEFLAVMGHLLHPFRNDVAPDHETLSAALGLAITAKADDAIIEDLLSRGADINAGDQTALMRAVDDSRRMKRLLALGAEVNKPNWYGKTPLMMAAHLDRPESTKLLLKRGADVNARTGSQNGDWCSYLSYLARTALMYAAENASAPVIEILLNAGADAGAVDSRGRGVLDYLSRNTTLADRERKAVQRKLLKAGAKN